MVKTAEAESRRGRGEKMAMSLRSLNTLVDLDQLISFHCFYPVEKDISSYCYFQIHLFFLSIDCSQINGAVCATSYAVVLVLVPASK